MVFFQNIFKKKRRVVIFEGIESMKGIFNINRDGEFLINVINDLQVKMMFLNIFYLYF